MPLNWEKVTPPHKWFEDYFRFEKTHKNYCDNMKSTKMHGLRGKLPETGNNGLSDDTVCWSKFFSEHKVRGKPVYARVNGLLIGPMCLDCYFHVSDNIYSYFPPNSRASPVAVLTL